MNATKLIIGICVFLSSLNCAQAQVFEETIFELNDSYIGGYSAFSKDLLEHLSYDRKSIFNNIESVYIIEFSIIRGELTIDNMLSSTKSEAIQEKINHAFKQLPYCKKSEDRTGLKISINFILDAASCEKAMICVGAFSLDNTIIEDKVGAIK